jgi:peptidoglycan/xylan/chitin deacetylase (PgdA/CDA1 family)
VTAFATSARNTFVVTTWDDADEKTGKLAVLLEKHSLRGTFFVPVRPVKTKRISDEEVRNLSGRFEIGSHSISHRILPRLPLGEVIREVRESRRLLQDMVGHPIDCFCYPGGYYNKDVVKEVESAGYSCARTTAIYRRRLGQSRYEIPTTIQVRKQPRVTLSIPMLVRYIGRRGATGIWLMSWVDLAKKMFDVTLKKGGVFHLWGHAWEVDRQQMWDDLENIFEHISGRKDVTYCSLAELVKMSFAAEPPKPKNQKASD